MAINDRFAYAWEGLASIHWHFERHWDAEAAFRMAIELDPAYIHARYNLALSASPPQKEKEILMERRVRSWMHNELYNQGKRWMMPAHK